MSKELNLEVVRHFIEDVWNQGQLERKGQYLTEDYVDHAYVPNNADGLENTVRMLHSAFPDQVSREESVTADGDRIVVRLRLTGTHLGHFRGTEATHNSIDVKLYREYRLVNGRIAEHWALFDTATLLRQIGAELHEQPVCEVKRA